MGDVPAGPELPHRRRRAALAVVPAVAAGVCLVVGRGSAAPLHAASPAPAGAAVDALPARGVEQQGSRADTLPSPEELVEEARGRQRSFERTRRRSFPRAGPSPSRRCDEIVGRYCLWHEDEPRWEPVPEPEEVEREREELLEQLARAERAAPGSGWVVGQRVRYLVEADRPEEALEVARACRAAGWWCFALRGYALHAAGRHRPAEAAFRRALVRMPEAERGRWTDLLPLVSGDVRELLEGARSEARDRIARRAWWLADPLYLVPGNERRAEHMSRWTAERMHRDAAGPFGTTWNDGLRELLIRYGPPVEYRRGWRGPYDPDPRPDVVGFHARHAQRFLPRVSALVDPVRAPADAWPLDDPEPRAGYAVPYADSLQPLEHRVARFWRRDSVRVVATYRLPVEEERGGGEAMLGLYRGPASPSAVVRRPGVEGVLWATVPARPHLLAVEALHPGASAAGRARYGLSLEPHPEGVPGLSDLLLYRPGPPGEAPASVEGAVPRARLPRPASPGEELGLFWEVYGPGRLLAAAEVSVALGRADGGWLRALARAVGLEGEAVGLEWHGAAPGKGRIHPASLRVTLPPGLEEGEYRLQVTVRVPGYEPLVSRRRLEVEAGGG